MKNSIIITSVFFSTLLLYAHTLEPPILKGSEDLLKSTILNPIDLKSDSKKQDKTPVQWGGNTLTQEERIVNGFQMKVFILGGGAYIAHKSVQLKAKEIEVIGEDAMIGNLKGQVIIEDKENGATLIANKGIYDKLAGTVSLENKPVLIHKKDGKTVRIHCDSIVRYLEEAKTVLSGKVVVTSLDFRVFGEDAIYYEKEDRIDLNNEPFLFTENRFLQGRTLSYFVKEGSIILEGDASIYLVNFEKKKGKLEDSKKLNKKTNEKPKADAEGEEAVKVRTLTIFSGEQLIHKNKSGNRETSTLMKNHANMFRLDSEFIANEIESLRNNKFVTAKGNVSYLDKENAYRMQGGYLEYDKEKGYSHLSEKPQIFFLDKETLEEDGNLKAVFIERFDERKEVVARGNVDIKTQSALAHGEYATYFEEDDMLVLEGNPSMIKEGTKVSAGKIIIYPTEDKAILTDGLKVIGNDQKN